MGLLPDRRLPAAGVYPGRDEPGCPIQKACVWVANFDLSPLELRCRKPAALVPCTHQHRHARGCMYVDGVGSRSVAAFPAAYTPAQGAVYAKACQNFCETLKSSSAKNRKTPKSSGSGRKTKLQTLADRSPVARGEKQTEVAPAKQRGDCMK